MQCSGANIEYEPALGEHPLVDAHHGSGTVHTGAQVGGRLAAQVDLLVPDHLPLATTRIVVHS